MSLYIYYNSPAHGSAPVFPDIPTGIVKDAGCGGTAEIRHEYYI